MFGKMEFRVKVLWLITPEERRAENTLLLENKDT